MSMSLAPRPLTCPTPGSATPRPRLVFAGLGWIGRNRMQALTATGSVEIAGLVDPDPARLREVAPGAETGDALGPMIDRTRPDGVVIASPSALHAAQALEALERGCAVFCQKPLGRDRFEAAAVVAAAEAADLPLGLDLSYRHTAAARALKAEIDSGRLGEIFAMDLVFHNAYGPDKAWFFDARQSGGGAMMDLGVHLVDLGRWLLGQPLPGAIRARMFREGRPFLPDGAAVEDFAQAELSLGGAELRIACSWHAHAGRDAVIRAEVWGSRGGAVLRNIDGSFHDFLAQAHDGTSRRVLTLPPDDWGGRALIDWAARLSRGEGFDPAAHRFTELAATLDAIYAAATSPNERTLP